MVGRGDLVALTVTIPRSAGPLMMTCLPGLPRFCSSSRPLRSNGGPQSGENVVERIEELLTRLHTNASVVNVGNIALLGRVSYNTFQGSCPSFHFLLPTFVDIIRSSCLFEFLLLLAYLSFVSHVKLLISRHFALHNLCFWGFAACFHH